MTRNYRIRQMTLEDKGHEKEMTTDGKGNNDMGKRDEDLEDTLEKS